MRAALLAIALGALPAAAQGPATTPEVPLASRVDYTRPGARALPVRCRPGDVEYFAGRTLGEVFGDAWPQPPAAARVTPAHVVDAVAPTWPKGLGQNGSVAVVAALVGPDGRALEARALCASAPAISKPAVRAALRSVYAPARFDGVPGTGVAIRVIRFGLRDAPETPVPDRPAPPERR